MNAGLHHIELVEPDVYEVVVDIDGERHTMRCRVDDRGEIPLIQPTPDLMSTLPFDPRLLASAVLAFARARTRTREREVGGQ